MPSAIDPGLVKKVANLARLELTEQQVNEFAVQLGAILEYFQQINRLDTECIEPLAHCLPLSNCLRDDQVTQPLDLEAALSNAPDRDGDFFKVPRILDEGAGP